MNSIDIHNVLVGLGHTDPAKGLTIDNDGVKRFQKHVGLVADGVIGPKTAALLDRYKALLQALPAMPSHPVPFRVTQYYFAEERTATTPITLPLFGVKGNKLVEVKWPFFSEAALEGSGIVQDGRAVNVAGEYVPIDKSTARLYRQVLDKYNQYVAVMVAKGKDPKPSRYFGFDQDSTGVTAVQTFRWRDDISEAAPYGRGKNGIPFKPFGTLATDTGYKGWKNPDPRYKGLGGLVPPGTRVYFLERDQWYIANDTGGGIYGAHVDEFCGSAAHRTVYPTFPRAHLIVDLPDANDRFPVGYELGLW